jgi:hypothetical protein
LRVLVGVIAIVCAGCAGTGDDYTAPQLFGNAGVIMAETPLDIVGIGNAIVNVLIG